MDKKIYTQIVASCVLTLLPGLTSPAFTLDRSLPSNPVVKSSLSDFVEPVLEKTIHLAQRALVVLSQVFHLDKNNVLSSFAAFVQIVKEQPVIFFGVMALLMGIPFLIYRSIKAGNERQKRLQELKESMEEPEESEAEDETPRPLVVKSPKTTDEEDADDEENFRPLTVAESRFNADPYDRPASEMIMANLDGPGDEDTETDNETGDKNTKVNEFAKAFELDFEAIENAGIGTSSSSVDSPNKEIWKGVEDEDLIKKLDHEFNKLESELLVTDSPPEKVSPQLFPIPESADIATFAAAPFTKTLAEETQKFAEAPPQSDEAPPILILDASTMIEEESPTEADQSIVDLQTEMEKTIRELSEQLQSTPKYEESSLGNAATFAAPPTAQPAIEAPSILEEAEKYPPEKIFETAESEPPPEDSMDPELAEMLKSAMQDEELMAVTATTQPVETKAEEKIPAPAEPGEIAVTDRAEIASKHSLDQIHEFVSKNIQPPPARKRDRIQPEKARHYVSRLLNFQKGLENRLQKLAQEKKPEAVKTVAVVVPTAVAEPVAQQQSPVLQTAKKNYENKKSVREKGNSLELLESFILQGVHKK